MVRAVTYSLSMRRAQPGIAASNGRPFVGVRSVAVACVLAAFGVLLAPVHEALAQAQTGLEQIVKPPQIGSGEPMLLQADEMVYDNDSSKITAKGNVARTRLPPWAMSA